MTFEGMTKILILGLGSLSLVAQVLFGNNIYIFHVKVNFLSHL